MTLKGSVEFDDPSSANMKSAQIAPNKMLRMLDRVTLKDHVTSKSLLLKYNLPSVNQLAAEIKLIEAWKSQNIPNYPLKLEPNIYSLLRLLRSLKRAIARVDEAAGVDEVSLVYFGAGGCRGR